MGTVTLCVPTGGQRDPDSSFFKGMIKESHFQRGYLVPRVTRYRMLTILSKISHTGHIHNPGGYKLHGMLYACLMSINIELINPDKYWVTGARGKVLKRSDDKRGTNF
jgi:hypothetical protein